MKTLVKYVKPREKILSVYCKPFRALMVTAERLVNEGFGDHTVQEDGKTVHVVQAQYIRLRGSNL